MKQTFTLFLLLLLLVNFKAHSQKALLKQTFDQVEFYEAFLFAKDKFYLNQGTHFEVNDFSSNTNLIVDKPTGQSLQKGRTFGAVGSSVLFSNQSNNILYIANENTSEPFQRNLSSRQIVTGKDYTYVLYDDLNGEGTKIIAVDSRTFIPQKAFLAIAIKSLDIKSLRLAYFEKENLLYFAGRTADNTVAVYSSEGSYESTKLLINLTEEVGSNALYYDFFDNGEELYLINKFYQDSDYKNKINHVYKISGEITDYGSFPFLESYGAYNYIKRGVFYGYDSSTQSIIKRAENSSSVILTDVPHATFIGEFKNRIIFAVRDEWDEQIDSTLVKLYETDGTTAGTRLITDKVVPPSFDNPDESIINFNGLLHFFKKDEAHGTELWSYNGQSISLVHDIITGPDGLMYPQFYQYEEELYFTARLTSDYKTLNLYKLSNSASTIELQSYADYNSNQVKDADEPLLPNVKYTLNNNETTILSTSGSSKISLEDGTYSLSSKPLQGWVHVAGEQAALITLPEDKGKVYSFGFKPEKEITKVDAALMSDATRCGFPTPYTLHYSNSGFAKASGTIKLKPEAKFTFESASPAPSSTSGDTLIWQITDLEIGQKKKIIINFTMPGVESMGDTLASKLYTNFKAVNNTSTYTDSTTLQQILTCSYDPNDIQANPAGLGEKHLTLKNKPLEYLIRFQNMGTDKAFNIVVKNGLQEAFDMSSFKVVGSSHDMYTVIKGNELSFHFDNIQLPDDKVDEPGSHGYVLYSIKPKAGLPDSTILNNQAFIYFDYNPAIETNIAFNTLVTRLPVPESVLGTDSDLADTEFEVYPNPADETLHILWNTGAAPLTNYQIFNSKGQQVLQTQVKNSSVHQLNVSVLPPGLYFLKAVKADRILVRKLIIR